MKRLNGEVRFAELNLRQIIWLDEKCPVEDMFVSEETVILINGVLGLQGLLDEDLQATRNAIVKHFSSDIEKYCMNKEQTKWLEGMMDLYDKLRTKQSMITAVIDTEIFNRGLMY